jgi:hypothetical protein
MAQLDLDIPHRSKQLSSVIPDIAKFCANAALDAFLLI